MHAPIGLPKLSPRTPTAPSNLSIAQPPPHSTHYFEFYLTKDEYDHTQPLNWSDLDDEPFCSISKVDLAEDSYRMSCPIPLGKAGRRILYSIWQRNDSQEAFYSCLRHR